MATYPEDPVPIYPLTIEPVWQTVVSPFDSGKEQRRQKSLFPKFHVTVQYTGLSASDVQTLWDFYMARKGAYEAFYIYDLSLLNTTSFAQDGLYVGTGDGSTEVFDIPGRSTSSQKIYVDSVEQTVTTDYVILTGGGDASSDRVDFVNPPNSGDVITCDFTGYLRIRARFAEDRLSRELFNYRLYNLGVKLRGLAAE